MKAAVLTASDAVPAFEDFAEPEVGAHSQLMTLVAAGLHPVTRMLATGAHYGSQGGYPLIPGVDAVARTADGQLVYTGWTQHPYGTFAERMAVPMGTPLPAGADPLQIAAGLNPGLSSWLPLTRRAAAGPLGTVLVLGATGVAGKLAVQAARTLGADRVIAVARDEVALAAVAAPLAPERITPVVLRGDADVDSGALAEALAAHRPRVVLDFLWGSPAEALFDALRRSGLDDDTNPTDYIEIGEAAGPRASIPASALRSSALTVRGSGAGSAPIEEIMAAIPAFMARIAEGSVRVDVAPYALNEVADAWSASTPGARVVITPPRAA